MSSYFWKLEAIDALVKLCYLAQEPKLSRLVSCLDHFGPWFGLTLVHLYTRVVL